MIIKLTYFKESDKYCAEGDYETDKSIMEDVCAEVVAMKRHPGLSTYWNGFILVSGYYPHLIDTRSK